MKNLAFLKGKEGGQRKSAGNTKKTGFKINILLK
jgi:hypothetical protein